MDSEQKSRELLMCRTMTKIIPLLGTSTHNGVSKGSSSQPGKPKPGTVAAALEEKKKAAAAAAAAEAASKASSNHDQEALNPANPASGLLQDKTKDNPTNQVQDSTQNVQDIPYSKSILNTGEFHQPDLCGPLLAWPSY